MVLAAAGIGMRKINYRVFLPVIFVTVIFSYFVTQSWNRPRILIYHSGEPKLNEVAEFDRGIKRSFANYSNYNIETHYMHIWYDHQHLDHKQEARRARTVIERFRPDVLLLVGDEAQEYIGKNYINHPKIKIVFSHITKEPKEFGYDKANNVTGQTDIIPFSTVEHLLNDVYRPSKKKLMLLANHTFKAQSLQGQIDEYDWKRYKVLPAQFVHTFKQWQDVVLAAPKQAGVLFLGYIFGLTDENGNEVSEQDVISWTVEHAKLPVFGLSAAIVKAGGPFAIDISGYSSAKVAAKICRKLLHQGIEPDKLGIRRVRQFDLYIDESAFAQNAPGAVIPWHFRVIAMNGENVDP